MKNKIGRERDTLLATEKRKTETNTEFSSESYKRIQSQRQKERDKTGYGVRGRRKGIKQDTESEAERKR